MSRYLFTKSRVAVFVCALILGLTFASLAYAAPFNDTQYDQTYTGTGPDFNITWTGTWTSFGPSASFNFYGGSYSYASSPTRSVTVNFEGDRIRWSTIKYTNSGYASVVLDGGAPTIVNLYAPNPGGVIQPQVVYDSGTLYYGGPHTLTITPTGTIPPGSTGPNVGVDSFTVSRMVVTSTPASSSWSVALVVLAGVAVGGGVFLRRALASRV